MKKLLVLLTLLSIGLFGCAKIPDEEPIPEEPIIEEPVDQWEVFNGYLKEYQATLKENSEYPTHHWIEKTSNHQYTREMFEETYSKMSSISEPRYDLIAPFSNIIERLIGYINDDVITGFNEVFEINPADFNAVLVIITFYETGEIFAHFVKEGLWEAAIYQSYHFMIVDNLITIESISTTISESTKPNFEYFKWIQNDSTTRLRYGENNFLSYDYYSLQSPDSYRIGLDDELEFNYISWYEPTTKINHGLSLSWEDVFMPSFSMYGDHNAYFTYETYETTKGYRWQMMEVDGWDYLYDVNFNQSQASETTGYFKASNKLFTNINNVFYNIDVSDRLVNLLLTIQSNDITVTNCFLNLSDFGLSFKDERLTKDFFDEQVEISLTKGQNNFTHQNFDFSDEDVVENFLKGLDSEFVPDELMMWFN